MEAAALSKALEDCQKQLNEYRTREAAEEKKMKQDDDTYRLLVAGLNLKDELFQEIEANH